MPAKRTAPDLDQVETKRVLRSHKSSMGQAPSKKPQPPEQELSDAEAKARAAKLQPKITSFPAKKVEVAGGASPRVVGSHELGTLCVDGRRVTCTRDGGVADAWCASALAPDETVLALDCEWAPPWFRTGGEDEKVNVLQLASRSQCLVLSVPPESTSLPERVAALLEDKAVMKVGFNLHGDITRLTRDFAVSVQNVHDLMAAARRCGAYARARSLGDLAAALLGVEMEKSGGPRTSNWSQWPLIEAQVQYAAMDATVTSDVYWNAPEAMRQPLPEAPPSPEAADVAADTDAETGAKGATASQATRLGRGQRACPGCGQGIACASKKCKHCGHVLRGTKPPTATGEEADDDDADDDAEADDDADADAEAVATGAGEGEDAPEGDEPRAADTAAGPQEPASVKTADSRQANFFVMMRNKALAPPNKGAKVAPEGTATCLEGLCFVVSGVLDSMDRAECHAYIARHGGRVAKSITKAVTHLLNDHGEVGPSKRKQVAAMGIPIVGEDTLFALVAERSAASPAAAGAAV